MTGASFSGTLDADALQVGGILIMGSDGENKASFKDVVLRSAKITGQIAMVGASFDGTLNADSPQVDSSLIMRSEGQNKASFKDVILRAANIKGHIDMTGASSGTLNAEALQVGGDLFMSDVYSIKESDMTFAHFGGILDLRGATLPGLDLAGASVGADLDLGGPGSTKFGEIFRNPVCLPRAAVAADFQLICTKPLILLVPQEGFELDPEFRTIG
jgi:uncharacterized protein YjbI with pentapeptide repeats